MNTWLEPKMTAGWHDLPKAHQNFTDIFYFAYVKGSLTEPLTDPPEGLSQPQGDLTGPQGSLNDLSGEDLRT